MSTLKLWHTKLDRENRFQTSRVQSKPKPKQTVRVSPFCSHRLSQAVSRWPHSHTFRSRRLEPTFTLTNTVQNTEAKWVSVGWANWIPVQFKKSQKLYKSSHAKTTLPILETCKTGFPVPKKLFDWFRASCSRVENSKTINYKPKMATTSQLFVT